MALLIENLTVTGTRLYICFNSHSSGICTPRRMGFKALLNAKAAPFLVFGQVFSAIIVQRNCQNGLLLKYGYMYRPLSINTQLRAWSQRRSTYAQLNPLYPSLNPLRHSRDKFFQALSRFSILQATESWAGPGNEANSSSPFTMEVTTRTSWLVLCSADCTLKCA